MKKLISSLCVSAGVALMLAFTNPVKTETFTVDTQRSSIDWIGRKVTGQHVGKINISSGELLLSGNAVKGGSFIMDMTSITSDNERLTGHLKTDDFFSVQKNATSKFVITKVKSAGADRVDVTGDLTIKGITESITFPASVKKQGNAVVAVAKGIKVNRAKYDIRYGSKSFFNDIGDKAIDDEFELAINLVAKK
ncbi:YceI family protein [Daejeonella oryzae]|uniref:YceI family protein n=1 Tax=Daejeonella oryzae TaxID=1122943 RepID=UPI00040F762D|nr:YceI family protein [Daejeonella oryzae]